MNAWYDNLFVMQYTSKYSLILASILANPILYTTIDYLILLYDTYIWPNYNYNFGLD